MRPALSALLWLLLPSAALAQEAKVTATKFENLPARLFYLDDTETVLYHDMAEGVVWISQDEGKKWDPAPGVPKGAALLAIEHPFDKRMAFILTKSTTHYRTDDGGKTWREWHVKAPPAFVANPLSFHSQKDKYDHILYLGVECDRDHMFGIGQSCTDVTYYTTDAFAHSDLLLKDTSRCQFAHSTKEFKHDAPLDMVYCVAFTREGRSLENSHLFQSKDFFKNDRMIVDFDVGEKNARGVVALGVSSKFAVAALKSPQTGEMTLYVTTDTKNWAQARFPHASNSALRENGYTVVESTTHSLGVDVLLHTNANIGNFFISNSNGTYFVESLKDTNRNDAGFVDFENIVGVEGVGLANVVANAREVEAGRAQKRIRSKITFDDGSSWADLVAPGCPPSDKSDDCALHLYSVTSPHNFGRIFSSTAPGFVMGVGSTGASLLQYDQCDTFLSTDAGVTWTRAREGAHKYEFGDKGALLVLVDDEQTSDVLHYSFDSGAKWSTATLPFAMRAKVLTTVPDSTSQQFLLIGALDRKHVTDGRRFVAMNIDFSGTRKRKCAADDMERWNARTIKGTECLMGHKQWYYRKKPQADCFVGDKFDDPEEHEEHCTCTDDDYECDYNYVRNEDKCVAMGPEPIPEGVCDPNGSNKYKGSSGWRLIPGNTCKVKEGTTPKDAKVDKDCSQAQLPEGSVSHQITDFPARIVQHAYFKNSKTILVRLEDNTVWQSLNEGFIWEKKKGKWLAFYMHPFSDDVAYLIGPGRELKHTTDTGRSWNDVSAPTDPNIFRVPVLAFHPKNADWIIWTGAKGCPGRDCHAVAHYSLDHGRSWHEVESYVRTCSWARDKDLKIDQQLILCESYRDKKGDQSTFIPSERPLQFIAGKRFYQDRTKIFDNIVGFTKFSEYLIVAQLPQGAHGLSLQVSLDGQNFATGLFPPNMRMENHAYTVLESTTDSVFLHLTMSNTPKFEWGNLMKSNSNGTYYSVSQEFVNRNGDGFVDFEKLIGLEGIAVVNVVANPKEAQVKGTKEFRTMITHNDGATWKPLTPPAKDSIGRDYACKDVSCALHIHGFTERYDPRATYSSPSVVGLMMAVGSVGEKLAPYVDSDTFLSRDGGFTWEEVHKDAHLWEFGDSGSVLVMANDEAPTDRVIYSLNEGLTWSEYVFVTNDKMRVKSIVTVTSDTSRKFVLFGHYARTPNHDVAVHLDFSQLTKKKCVLNLDSPTTDDFELWSPSEEREERCLFGRRVLYHRRIRDRNCFVGGQLQAPKFVENCVCSAVDFECEFNHVRNNAGECVLVEGAKPLPNEPTCRGGEKFWYERTPYRRIPHSSCEGGDRPDRGKAHPCPAPGNHSAFFWIFISFIIIAFTVFAAYYFYERSMYGPGAIRLPGDSRFDDAGALSTLASVPWFVLGLVGVAWSWIRSIQLPYAVERAFQSRRRGYRHVPVDEDAQVLRFEDED
ncbi:Oligoxyloglucan reducing end-specific cellobiohydrolase [Auricularia subglabra TFB-10046 SS5]|uniref:Oligoxyloglucan reducing end-specific cellobiohydrolase n=1 Tax=Auricularia subglabra (strain TFB-10046 / SS5) TaxID=717982 RepID=J0WYT4_AURST|nr:Oligoxyloglucan reducing end-specific cellobiohydrolase [Auricularia subglabra TFB-10046 SS5]